jgi:hypothetical protein
VVTANATLLKEKRNMGDGKGCCPLMKQLICHHRVHRPLLADFCRLRQVKNSEKPPVDGAIANE